MIEFPPKISKESLMRDKQNVPQGDHTDVERREDRDDGGLAELLNLPVDIFLEVRAVLPLIPAFC